MKQKKDLFELFRENANNVEQKPTKKAWDRLEQRLDQHVEKRKSFSIRRILYIAAGVVGVIGIASVILPYLTNQSATSDMAMNEIYVSKAKSEMEIIAMQSEEEQGFYKIVEFRRKHQDRLSNPSFQEGKPAKLMVAYNNSGSSKVGVYTEDQFKASLLGGKYGDCIESIAQDGGQVSITFSDTFSKCKNTSIKKQNTNKSETVTSREDMQLIGSVQILKLLNFVNEVEIKVPENNQVHSFKISRTDLSIIPNSPLVNTSKDWYSVFYNQYIKNPENKQALLDKFSAIKQED